MEAPVEHDIAAVAHISAVPTILRVISEWTGLRFVFVARVTDDSWTACAVLDDMAFGLKPGDRLDVNTTLCSEVRDTREPIAFDHASLDPRYREHPTPKMYGLESYVAVPLYRPTGEFFGTLCGLDARPAEVNTTKTLAMMNLYAELISLQLRDEAAHARSEAALAEARDDAELRERFIAVLGHDVRNPLSSIAMGADLLLDEGLPAPTRSVVERVRRSALRIDLLVADLLDFTRGRLGGGISLAPTVVDDLEARLRHVVDEVASRHAGRVIDVSLDPCGPVVCDRPRVEQALSNLLANAFEHGAPSEPIEVALRRGPSALTLGVRNGGEPIPADVRARLFQPFYRRGAGGEKRDGLGLGLYIVAEIARAHGGAVEVASSAAEGTIFTLTLPLAVG